MNKAEEIAAKIAKLEAEAAGISQEQAPATAPQGPVITNTEPTAVAQQALAMLEEATQASGEVTGASIQWSDWKRGEGGHMVIVSGQPERALFGDKPQAKVKMLMRSGVLPDEIPMSVFRTDEGHLAVTIKSVGRVYSETERAI